MGFGEVLEYLDMAQSGKDETGLGRWVVMTLSGETKTRIVCGYNPCGNDKPNSGTVYHQQRVYWVTTRHSLVCPRVKFREDLLAQLRQWREEGDKLVVCLDANEDIYKKLIGKALTDIDGLAMMEVVGAFTGIDIGPTYFRGSKPIDAIWATTDVQVVGASIMPAGFGVGDHHLFVIDFLGSLLLGHAPNKIVQPQARRLNCNLTKSVEKYTTCLEQKILKHRLIECTGRVYTSGVSGAEAKQQLDVIDMESKNYMKNAEKKCRAIKSGRIPFSPESAKWIRQCQIYRSLLRFLQGGGKNRGNLQRAAYRANIAHPFALSEEDVKARLQLCQDHCSYYRTHGRYFR